MNPATKNRLIEYALIACLVATAIYGLVCVVAPSAMRLIHPVPQSHEVPHD